MAWQDVLFYLFVLLGLLLASVPVFFAAHFLIHRFWPAQRHPNRVALVLAAISTPLLCIAGLYLALAIYLYYPHRDFDPTRWATNQMKRYEMVDDLQGSHRLIGLREDQVIALLGKPDMRSDNSLEYYLGMTPKLLPIDGDALSIVLQNGRVTRCYIHET